jgi:Zn-dependent metalloprotease
VAQNDGTDAQSAEREVRRRRRRRRMVYGGAGGGLVLAAIAVYVVFFVGVVTLTVDQAMKELSTRHPRARMTLDARTRFVNAISNLDQTTTQAAAPTAADSARVAVAFVEDGPVAAALGVPKRARLVASKTFADVQREGFSVVRIQQFVDKVRLFGGDIAVSVRNGPSAAISSVVAQGAEVPDIDLTPAIDEAAAQKTALAHYATLAADPRTRLPKDSPVRTTELVVFDPARFGLRGSAALTWLLSVGPVQMFVDANANRVSVAYDTRHAVRTRLTHDCNLGANCRLVLTETGAVPPPPPPDATRVHADMASAHGYFLTHFQRNGFDDGQGTGGAGGTEAIKSFVRIANLNNAQWVSDDKRFDFAPGWTTLDIAAHEYTHAVITFGPNLTYLGEPGAVNEFFADFFAAMIERETTGIADWRIGEGVVGFSATRPLRDMKNPRNGMFNPKQPFDPATNGGQPDHFNDLVTTDDLICSSIVWPPLDNECVHFNSGILNRAMTLAIDGEPSSGGTIQPIAREKLEQIMFRTLMFGGVTSSSGLKATASGAVVSCQQLIGPKFQIAPADCSALGNAFAAVGLK